MSQNMIARKMNLEKAQIRSFYLIKEASSMTTAKPNKNVSTSPNK